MSKSEQPIALIDAPDCYNGWLRELVHTWTNIEFVQEVLAQLPNIKAFKRELVGFDGGYA
jgi:hypothetical protein